MRSQIRWWIENIEYTKMYMHTYQPWKTDSCVITDAASFGWGGHLNREYGKSIVASGVWFDSEATLHSNDLELRVLAFVIVYKRYVQLITMYTSVLYLVIPQPYHVNK